MANLHIATCSPKPGNYNISTLSGPDTKDRMHQRMCSDV